MQDFNPHLPRGRWLIRWVWTAYQSDFNPHLPRGRWHRMSQAEFEKLIFQSTPSSRKVTTAKRPADHKDRISIHTFLAEGDINGRYYISIHLNFNPHLPRGRWLSAGLHPAAYRTISIHTFLAEGDLDTWVSAIISVYFNPHLPRGRWLQKYL